MRSNPLKDIVRLLARVRPGVSWMLGRSRDDKGIGRTSAAVLVLSVFCTGLASYAYLRQSLVNDRTTIIEAELERRSQQLSMAVTARMQMVRALATRGRTARAMHTYEADQTELQRSGVAVAGGLPASPPPLLSRRFQG